MNALVRVWGQFREKRLIQAVRPYTLVSPDRIHNLYVLAKRIEEEGIPGDVVECGVYNGGTAAILARAATRSTMNRTVWLFDSFQGMPPTTEVDGDAAKEWVGKLAASPEKVREVLKLTGAKLDRVRIVEGLFEESFKGIEVPRIAILNLDCDWYDSVKLCLHKFYDCVVPGGFVCLDDYGYWPGCRRAVDEFFRERSLPYTLQVVNDEARWFQKA
jgi:O-methyltransferase